MVFRHKWEEFLIVKKFSFGGCSGGFGRNGVNRPKSEDFPNLTRSRIWLLGVARLFIFSVVSGKSAANFRKGRYDTQVLPFREDCGREDANGRCGWSRAFGERNCAVYAQGRFTPGILRRFRKTPASLNESRITSVNFYSTRRAHGAQAVRDLLAYKEKG